MANQKESLNKKDLNQVAGGGLGASTMKPPSRGKSAKDSLALYRAYLDEERKQGKSPMQFQDWLKLRKNY